MADLTGADAERPTVRREMAVRAWPRPAAEPPRTGTRSREDQEPCEEVPTLPWWERPRHGPGGRLLRYAVALPVVLVLTAVVGAVALG